jgi:hypothetical protein
MELLISLASVGKKHAYTASKPYGMLYADWKKDLAEEEDEDYLPSGYDYNKVLELGIISATEIGKGYGDRLMKEFLVSPVAKKAELIFLDPVPNVLESTAVPEHVQIAKLAKFYEKHGFRRNPKSNRMWLVQKGSIPTNKLPT